MYNDKDFEIIFGKSSSSNYNTVINLMKKFSDYNNIDENNKVNIIRIDSEEIFNKYKTFEKLYSLIYGWKSTTITFKGQEIQPYNFFNHYNQVFKCSKEYNNNISSIKHCNLSHTLEGWGCKFLTNIKKHLNSEGYYYSNEKYWYKFGSFESEKIWKINKEEIIANIKQEIEEKEIQHCPIFSFESILDSINKLPDVIDLNENKNWEIEYKEDFIGTTIQKIPISINHFSKESNKKNSLSFSLSEILTGVENNDVIENSTTERKRYIPDVSFDDIGGIDNIIDQIREVIELPLKRPEIYEHLGIKPHKGILLYGDPGNGKTLVAKSIANEVQAHFIPVSGPELISKWHGQSEENLRNIFQEARELQPSIIFFDEIDSIAQKRTDDENGRLDAKFVNQLLTLMDGMETFNNVTVLASTNRPELLDEALLRPGRFDYKIEIKKPDLIGCYKVLKVASKKMPLDDALDLNKIVSKIVGCSGAEIVFIVKESAINALKRSINIKNLILEEFHTEINLSQIKVNEIDFIRAIEKLKENSISDNS